MPRATQASTKKNTAKSSKKAVTPPKKKAVQAKSKSTGLKKEVMKEKPNPVVENESKNKDAELFRKIKSDYRWKVFGQSAFITLSSIFILGGTGWMIDEWIARGNHTFLIIFLVISYPLTQIALYKKMKNFKIKN